MDTTVHWLINAVQPVFTGTVDPSLLLSGFERLSTSNEHLLCAVILGCTLLVIAFKTNALTEALSEAVVLLPIIGATLQVITVGQALFIFALEVIFYFIAFAILLVAQTILDLWCHFNAPAPINALPESKIFHVAMLQPVVTLILLVMIGCLSVGSVFAANQAGGSMDYLMLVAPYDEPPQTDDVYRQRYAQIVSAERRCLNQDPLSDAQLTRMASAYLAKRMDRDDPLRGLWQKKLIWGPCTPTAQSAAPWFMGLCLLIFIIRQSVKIPFNDENAPNGGLTALSALFSLRLFAMAVLPALAIEHFIGHDHILLAYTLFFALERLIRAPFLSDDDVDLTVSD